MDNSNKPQRNEPDSSDARLSPVRPIPPVAPSSTPSSRPDSSLPPTVPESPNNPVSALGALRQKMEQIADEFSSGKLNRGQFYALYRRYNEQRAIIEGLVKRDPDTAAWKQVVSSKGQTGFLRTYFAAQTVFFAVFRHRDRRPILMGGSESGYLPIIEPILTMVWSMDERPKQGLGRRQIGEQKWLILAIGEYAASSIVWSTEPSMAQARLARDLHADFERANQAALVRGWINPEKMVFPQRALLDQKR